jgi:putative transposase
MPRPPRIAPANFVFHVLNRANNRAQIFRKEKDYSAFERILAESAERTGMRVLGYSVMPNHWHLVLWPDSDGQLPEFMHHLTTTHVRRWHEHHHTVGNGHLYQGTYKSFPVETDEHLLTVCRYVERNPVRAKLVGRAEDWTWSSAARRHRSSDKLLSATPNTPPLAPLPLDPPRDWLAFVNSAPLPAETESVRHAITRSAPYGRVTWQAVAARALGLEATLRPRGRPRKRG